MRTKYRVLYLKYLPGKYNYIIFSIFLSVLFLPTVAIFLWHIHSIIHSSAHSFIHLFMNVFKHTFIHSYIYMLIIMLNLFLRAFLNIKQICDLQHIEHIERDGVKSSHFVRAYILLWRHWSVP